MVDDQILALAKVMREVHGTSAEKVARQRAARCARQREQDWAERWRKVADHIAGLPS